MGVILGNQKLLIPNMLRVTARVARSSRIPGIHEGDSRWRRRETDAEAENTKNTANKLTHTRQIDKGAWLTPATEPVQPNLTVS